MSFIRYLTEMAYDTGSNTGGLNRQDEFRVKENNPAYDNNLFCESIGEYIYSKQHLIDIKYNNLNK